ncbi:MAG: recombinase family protein [Myxococcaceae bacterium]
MERERRPCRCAVYTRQSVARADGPEFTSCDAQHDACLAFVKAHAPEGWIAIDERFDDLGSSGATMERPALERLLNRVRIGDIDRVVVFRLDRLTRSVLDWADLISVFKRRGTQLSVVSGDLGLGELATSDLLLNMMAAFAEFEREMISDRLRDARAAHRRRGIRSGGRIPFGYRADALSHQLVIEPTEAAVVKSIFERAAGGGTPAGIALALNTKFLGTTVSRVATRQGWTAKSVLRVLGNRTYLGQIGEVPDRHESIVTAELFERVRAVIIERRTREPARRPPPGPDLFLLRGLLRCTRCGHLMTTSTARALPDQRGKKRVKDEVPRYYRCRGPKACPGSQVSARDIEGRVVRWFLHPTGSLTEEAREVFGALGRLWRRLPHDGRQRVIAQLIWEVRWNGSKNRFTVMLDDTAIRETHLGLEVEREEAKAQAEAARDERRPRRAQQPRSQGRGAGR